MPIEKKSRKLEFRRCRGLLCRGVGVEYVADKVVPAPGLDRGSKCCVKFHEKILKTIHFVLTAHSTLHTAQQRAVEAARTAFGMKRQRSRWKCRIDMLLFSSDKEYLTSYAKLSYRDVICDFHIRIDHHLVSRVD